LKKEGQITLGIESAIAGGSLSLYKGATELASWIGDDEVARAENLLPNVEKLLGEMSFTIKDIDTIVVSRGPGSFTGIRVSIATVLGLRASLNVRCVGLSALEAIAFTSEEPNVLATIPMGRDLICFQQFIDRSPVSEPILIPPERLANALFEMGDSSIAAHTAICDAIRSTDVPNLQVIDVGTNIASLLCRSAPSGFASEDLQPLFIDRRAFTKI
jgi:tRNA threonylcarbamoyl adenosine modification protein YeaZ